MDSFQLKDVLAILEMDRGRFNEWVSRGLVQAEHWLKKGSRIHKEYSKIDIYAIAIFKTLLDDAQLPRENAAQVSKMWRSVSLENGLFTQPLFLIREKDLLTIIQPATPSQDFKDGGSDLVFNVSVLSNIEYLQSNSKWRFMFVVNTGQIIDETNARIALIF